MRAATLLLISLLYLGCDPGIPVPPLCRAAREGDTAGIAELVRSGADVNERGGVNDWTALMHAVHKNQPKAVEALIDAGADVNAKAGARGRDTALRLAEMQGLRDIAAMLRDHGARVGRTPSSAPAPRVRLSGAARPLLTDRRGRRPQSGGPPHKESSFNKFPTQDTRAGRSCRT
jgi:ankyrin repeat protein